ncbi:phage portal protein [Streptomyces sp. NPDC127595]
MTYNRNEEQRGFWARILRLPEKRSTPPEFGGPLAPSRPTFASHVTPDSAMTISAVYRAVSLLSGHVSQLPVGVWRGDTEVPSPALVTKPDVNSTQTAFKQMTTVSLATSGNAYWRVYRESPTAKIQNLQVLNPHSMTIEQDLKSGKLTYRYHDERGDYTFQDWQIKHLSLMRIPGSLYGIGPIQAAQAELRGTLDLRDYASNWFRSGGVPTGVLKTDQALTPDQATAYRERWESLASAGRGVAVLGNGMGYQPVHLNPADAQFLESQQFSITQIARMFGVPAGKLLAEVNGNSMTYTNLESANTDFVRDTLTSYLIEIEEALSDLIPRGSVVRFKVDALLRADKATRYATYSTALASGFMTVDEIRKEEGLPPMPLTERPKEVLTE